MSQPDRPPTVLEVCVGKVGMIRGTRVIADLAWWALAMSRAGDDWPQGDDRGVTTARVRLFRDAAIYSEVTAWRRLAAFRECFPNEADPTRLVEALNLHVVDKRAARKLGGGMSLWNLPVPS
jgi:hypothetical protein